MSRSADNLENHPLWDDYAVDESQIDAISRSEVETAWTEVFSLHSILPCVTSDLSRDLVIDQLRRALSA